MWRRKLIIGVDARIVDSLGFRLGSSVRSSFVLKPMGHGKPHRGINLDI
jgi:hypothetical protein